MPRPTLSVLIALCAFLSTSASAQPQPQPQPETKPAQETDPSLDVPEGVTLTPGRENAALQYYANWILLEPLLEFEPTDEESGMLDEGPLPPRYTELLENHQDDINRLIRATHLTRCDFGTNLEEGPGAVLPYLGKMRETTRILARDARRLIENDPQAASERLAATIRMADHTTESTTIIGSLVAMAMVNMAIEETNRHIQDGALTADDAAALLTALDRLDTGDPFGERRALETERDMMSAWVASYLGENDQAITAIEEMMGDAAHTLRDMNDAQLTRQSELMRQGYDDLLAAWNAENPQEAIREVESRIETQHYGLIGSLLMPALGKFHERSEQITKDLEAFRTELQDLEGN